MFHRLSGPNIKKGFTLIELLVVVAIIGFLSSVVLASLNSVRVKARDAQRLSDIRQIRSALELYRNDNGAYPGSGGAYAPNGGWSNSNDSSWATLGTVLSPYIKNLPHDPKESPSDTTINPWPGAVGYYSYVYFANGYLGCTTGQYYFIAFRPEVMSLPSYGVKMCDGSTYNIGAGGVLSGVSQVQ